MTKEKQSLNTIMNEIERRYKAMNKMKKFMAEKEKELKKTIALAIKKEKKNG